MFYKTPLHISIEKGYFEIFKTLLDKKEIDVNITAILKLIFIKFNIEYILMKFKIQIFFKISKIKYHLLCLFFYI